MSAIHAPMQARDRLLALAVVTVWGVNFVVIKVGLAGVPPFLLAALRFVLVAFPAVFLVRRPKVPWRMLIAYAATISVAQFGFLFYAIAVGMPAGLASLVLQAQAFFTLAIAAVWLGEPVRWHNVLGMLVAAGGLALIGAGAGAGPHGISVAGFFFTLCAALSWASGNIVSKRIGAVDPLGLVVWGGLIPIVPFSLLSLCLEGPARIVDSLSHFNGMSVFAVIYLAFVSTIFGYALWARLLARYPTPQVAPLTLLVPVVGLVSAHLMLGEDLGAAQWAGAGIVMAGLLVNVFGARLRAALATVRT